MIRTLTGSHRLLGGRSGSFRRDLRRAQRRAEEQGLSARAVPPEDVERALSTLESLHRKQFDDKSALLPVFSRFSAAVLAANEVGEVVFDELIDDNGNAVAIHVLFQVAGRAFGLFGGLDPRAPSGAGRVLRASYVDRSCVEGLTEFDFSTEGSHWKRSWSNFQRDQVNIFAAQGTFGRFMIDLREWRRRLRRRRRDRPNS